MYRRYGKRALDLAGSLAVLVVLAPLLALAALAIRLTSKGPVFYLQERIGKDGIPFQFIKFRTMIVGAERTGAGILCLQDDPRITGIGRILRRLSLDEIPQLINVLRGEMSLIGPRPGLAYQVKEYTAEQRRRLTVLPGLTGWAQVNGRNSLSWDERIRLDLEYINRLSFLMDLRILVLTVRTVLAGSDMLAAKDYFQEKAVVKRQGGQ